MPLPWMFINCLEEGCDWIDMNGFETESKLKIHPKQEHINHFWCPGRGCDRVGTNGWIRMIDM
ncbi:hypothetical protein BJ875DRAFT_461340 [Amylocarpus encephaloides]|uniref:Uncharacterized protein n=1 Tax=Amylocarpus encephaloides TaxID=45428 RepID=A0A9P8C5D9_9HELO|nr:hypothetical protein BJ875DRAFT_461340 [Amylocarpus encephaloides]